jgi:hypothetical protein
VTEIDDWYERVRCHKCGKVGMATVSQVEGKTPTAEVVPDGFKTVRTARGPDFHCTTCKVAVYP